jgi:hypothetical protein
MQIYLSSIGQYQKLFVIGLLCQNVMAADWQLDGNLNQVTGYDDNFRLGKPSAASYEWFLTPTVNFKRNATDWNINGSASYGFKEYTYNSTYDNNPQNYKASTEYRTARSKFGLSADYVSLLLNNIAASDTGNFTTTSSRTIETLSPTYSYSLDSLNSLKISGSYIVTDYSVSASNSSKTSFTNYNTGSANLGWTHDWDARLSNTLSGSYTQTQFASTFNGLSKTYNLSLGVAYELSSQWKINTTLGERLTQQSYSGVSNSGSSTSGWTADAEISHIGLQSSESASLTRLVTPSGQGVINEQTSMTLSYQYALSSRWDVAITGNYLINNPLSQAPDSLVKILNRTYFSITPKLNWKVQRDIDVSLSYIYRQQDYSYTAVSKALMLTFNYNWSGLNISR